MTRGLCSAQLQLLKYAPPHPHSCAPFCAFFVHTHHHYMMACTRCGFAFTHVCVKDASYRAHFELAVFLWQQWANTGDSPPPVEVEAEIVSSLERCLQLHPTNADALKALSLFHLDVRRDSHAAVRVLEALAEVPLPAAAAHTAAVCRRHLPLVLRVSCPPPPPSDYTAQGVGAAAVEGAAVSGNVRQVSRWRPLIAGHVYAAAARARIGRGVARVNHVTLRLHRLRLACMRV